MNILRLSWKNLLDKPWSLMLSLVLFGLGVGLISLLMLLNTQLEEKFSRNLAGVDLVVGAKGSPLQLILSSMYHLDAPTGNIPLEECKAFLNPRHPIIAKAVPLSLGDSYRAFRIVGTDTSFFSLYQAQVAKGVLFRNAMEVTIGATVAAVLKLNVGDTFQSSHGLIEDDQLVHEDAAPFRVVGILEPTGAVVDQLILTDTRSVWMVHGPHVEEGEGEDHDHADSVDLNKPLYQITGQSITCILIQFKGRNIQALNMQRSINENTNLQAATPAIEINRLYSLLGTGAEALRWLAIIIVLVSGLSIFISLFSSLRERRYELAVMRTLGASPGVLFALIITEGLILAILGYILGILLSHGGMELLARYMEDSYRYAFTGWRFLQEEFWLLGGALLIGFLAAIIPAWQARNTDIHNTLSEG